MSKKTNFFKLLKQTSIQHININMIINKDDTVSIVLQTNPTTSKDNALLSIKPITFTDTIENTDAEFFNTIEQEVKNRQTLYTNVEEAEKDRKEKATQTEIAKKENEKYKKAFEKLQNLVNDKDFNAKEKEHANKALQFVETVLELKPNCIKTKKIKATIQQTRSKAELF